jgi:RimJ/RimL family protein N-acetyltransferase
VTELLTPRLRLRRWRESDVDAMAAINAHPDVSRWIGDGSGFDRTASAAEIARFDEVWQEHGFGRFAIELLDTGQLAGFTGMAILSDIPEIMPAVEIGWRLGRDFWGRGLATEASAAALTFAADAGLKQIVAVHLIGNDASARVMQRLGMHFDRETTENVYGLPVHVYTIDLPPGLR